VVHLSMPGAGSPQVSVSRRHTVQRWPTLLTSRGIYGDAPRPCTSPIVVRRCEYSVDEVLEQVALETASMTRRPDLP